MVTQFTQDYSSQRMVQAAGNSKLLATAVFVGLLLGALATMLLAGMSGWGLLGIWVLCMSMAWIGVAILSQRLYKQAQWGMVVAGQAMGAVAVLLLIFVAI